MIQSKFGRIVLVLTAFLVVTACGTDRNDPQANDPYRANQFNMNGVQSFDNNGADRNMNGNMGMQRTPGMNNTNLHQNSRIQLSQAIADRVAAMEEVDSANVLVTDQNIYVAVVLEDNQGNNDHNGRNNGDVPIALKNKIAKEAKSINAAANHVYVSANPDFVSRINGYVDQIQEGRPIQGLIHEFNTLVQRIFPTDAGTDTNDMRMMNSRSGANR